MQTVVSTGRQEEQHASEQISRNGRDWVDRMGNLADQSQDGAILRLENLDTDLRPPPGVEEATRQAVAEDDANSYLPFLGADPLRQAAAALVSRLSGVEYDWRNSTIVSAGGLNGILNVLLALLEPGDEVILTDPIYIGLVNRVRLAGGVPVFAPYQIEDGVWRLDRERLRQAVTAKTKVLLMMSPAMPPAPSVRARIGTASARLAGKPTPGCCMTAPWNAFCSMVWNICIQPRSPAWSSGQLPLARCPRNTG